MKRIVFISTLILSIGLFNCSRKPVVICGLVNLESRSNIDSKIVQLERIAIADTTIAFVSGEIFGKDSSDSGVTIDTLIGAVMYLVDQKTGKTFSSQTDIQGKYNLHFPASTYDIKVQYIAYNTLVVRNVYFGTGDMVVFDAMLGQSSRRDDSTIFEMQADKTIKKIRLPVDENK